MATGASTPSLSQQTKILVLLTSDISSVLVKGQLAFLVSEGFQVEVGTAQTQPIAAVFDPGVAVHHLPFVRQPAFRQDVRALIATIRLIRQLRPDLVNVSTPKAGLVGMIAAWLCRVPVRVYTVRGFRFETMTGRRQRFYLRLEKLIISRAHQVIFNSASLLKYAESLSIIKAGRGVVLGAGSGNGIDLDRFAGSVLPDRVSARSNLGIPADAIAIGFVGRLTADKGLDDLVAAFSSLSHEFQAQATQGVGDPWLVIAGTEEAGDPIQAVTRQTISQHPRILDLGWVDKTTAVYPALDVLAFPSYREGFPNVPLEAQLCGVPVVGYAATGTIDAVRNGETGILVPVGDQSELASALKELLTDEQRRSRMGPAGIKWVQNNFDRRTIWAELTANYRQWLAGLS